MKRLLHLLFLSLCFLASAGGLLAQTPVAHYDFSGSAKDVSSFANTATVNGARLVQDRFGWANSAMDFDGIQGAVTAPNASHLNSANATISFWVKPTAFPGQGEVYLLSNGGWQQRWKISLPAHGKPVFTTHSGGACCSDMDSGENNELQIGVWTHVVMVHDGAKNKIFFNGALMNEKDVSGALDATTHPLGIGYDPIDNANFFNGALDEVMIFDVALSDAQITALYNAQNTPPTVASGVVASYLFNGDGLDGSGFGNHADLKGAASATDRFGFGRSAALCDGASTEITAPNSAHLNSPFTTVSFWVKPNSLPGSGEVFLLSFGGWQERWKISLPPHGKPVWTTNHSNGISDMDSGDGNTLQAGEWKHVVMVHDGAKDKIFMNGALVAEKDVAGTLNSTTYPLGIGYNVVDGGNWFDGVIDEVLIYNYALSDGDITALYAAQSAFPGTPTDLVAHYSLNGNGADETQFHNHAALGDGATGVANRHGWGSNALEGYATADNSAALQSDNTTISFWVKPNSLPAFGEVIYCLTVAGRSAGKSPCRRTASRYSPPTPAAPAAATWTPATAMSCKSMPGRMWSWYTTAQRPDLFSTALWSNEKDVARRIGQNEAPARHRVRPDRQRQFLRRRARRRADLQRSAQRLGNCSAVRCPKSAPTVPGNLVAHYPFSGNSLDATDYNNHASPAVFARDRFGKGQQSGCFQRLLRKLRQPIRPNSIAFYHRQLLGKTQQPAGQRRSISALLRRLAGALENIPSPHGNRFGPPTTPTAFPIWIPATATN
jgi:hypothetical protein